MLGRRRRKQDLRVRPDRRGMFGNYRDELRNERVGFVVLREVMGQHPGRLRGVVAAETASAQMIDDLVEVDINVIERRRDAPLDQGHMNVRLDEVLGREQAWPRPPS